MKKNIEVYEANKIYVLEYRGSENVYMHILLGMNRQYTWYSCENANRTMNRVVYNTEQGAIDAFSSRKDCIIHTFSKRNEALKFMMEH